jgi:hypothetical protein
MRRGQALIGGSYCQKAAKPVTLSNSQTPRLLLLQGVLVHSAKPGSVRRSQTRLSGPSDRQPPSQGAQSARDSDAPSQGTFWASHACSSKAKRAAQRKTSARDVGLDVGPSTVLGTEPARRGAGECGEHQSG